MVAFAKALAPAIETYRAFERVFEEAFQRYPRNTRPEPPAIFHCRTFSQLGGDGNLGLAFLRENGERVPSILEIPEVKRVIEAAAEAEDRRRAEEQLRRVALEQAQGSIAERLKRNKTLYAGMAVRFVDGGERPQSSLNPARELSAATRGALGL